MHRSDESPAQIRRFTDGRGEEEGVRLIFEILKRGFTGDRRNDQKSVVAEGRNQLRQRVRRIHQHLSASAHRH